MSALHRGTKRRGGGAGGGRPACGAAAARRLQPGKTGTQPRTPLRGAAVTLQLEPRGSARGYQVIKSKKYDKTVDLLGVGCAYQQQHRGSACRTQRRSTAAPAPAVSALRLRREREKGLEKEACPNLQLERRGPVVVVGGRLSSLRPAAGQSVKRCDAAAVLKRELKRNTIAVSKKCREGPVSDELCP